jgi:C_GCAxxG_C_C family probable redox protein
LGFYNRNHDYRRLCRDCSEYYRRFMRLFGTSKCRAITGIRFKESYDIRRLVVKGVRCLRAVYNSIESVFEIIGTPDSRPFLKNTYGIRPPFDPEKFHCTNAVLSRVQSHLDLSTSSVSNAARGFSGGIAFQGDICGAFMGGVLALGIAYGTDLQRTRPTGLFKTGLVAMKEGGRVFQKEHLHPSFKTSLRVGSLYRKFVSRFGSANCYDILGGDYGFKGKDFCEEIAKTTAQLTLDLIGG